MLGALVNSFTKYNHSLHFQFFMPVRSAKGIHNAAVLSSERDSFKGEKLNMGTDTVRKNLVKKSTHTSFSLINLTNVRGGNSLWLLQLVGRNVCSIWGRPVGRAQMTERGLKL